MKYKQQMKKSILIALLSAGLLSAAAQTKTPAKADSAKVKYNYFVVVPLADYQQVFSSLNEYKRLQMYDPTVSADQKVKLFQGIETYLRDIPGRVKIDSVKIVPPVKK